MKEAKELAISKEAKKDKKKKMGGVSKALLTERSMSAQQT